MSDITKYDPGTFNWAEAGMSDVAGAKRFYGEVLGWSFKDMPMGEGAFYSMAQVRGRDVAGVYPQQPQMSAQGVPPHWLCYISVQSADESAARAEKLGAKVVMAPFDVMEVGRMAILQDPTGATVSLWEPKAHAGAGVLAENGAMCWNELVTTDVDKASAFYQGLFGWEPKRASMPGVEYTIFSRGEQQIAGLMKIAPEMGPMPPSWMLYFAVDDCDAAVARAQRNGGKVLNPPMDVPTVGRMATLQDEQGAVFSIVALEKPAA